MYLGDFSTGSTVFFAFTTVASSGPAVALSSGGITVYKNGSTAPNATGVTLSASFNGVTGLNHVQVDMVATSTFYAPAASFIAVVSSGAAGTESIAGYTVAQWSVLDRGPVTVSTAVLVSSAVSISTATAIDSVTSVNSTVDADVRQWLGTAPAAVDSTGRLLASTGSTIGGVANAVTVSTASVISTVTSVSNAVSISTASAIDSVTGVNSTVDADVRQILGAAVASTTAQIGANVIASFDKSGYLINGTITDLDTLNTNANARSTATDALIIAKSTETQARVASASTGTDGLIGALNDLSSTQVNDEVVDALNVDTYAEPTGVPPATNTLVGKLGLVAAVLRNKITVSSSAKVFYTDAGAVSWAKQLSQDTTGSTGIYTEAEASTST